MPRILPVVLGATALGAAAMSAAASLPFWRRHLANGAMNRRTFPALPDLRPDERVLVVSPHPDDEILGCGGLLQKIAPGNARIVFLTCGDGSRTTQLSEVLRGPQKPNSLVEIAKRRQIEAQKAAATLGIEAGNLVFLGYPDGGLETISKGDFSPQKPFRSQFTGLEAVPYQNARTPNAPFCRASLEADLSAEIAEFGPTLILTTHGADTHPDHRAAWILCEKLAGEAKLWSFLVHYGVWPTPNGLHPALPMVPPAALQGENWRSLALSPTEIRRKKRALAAYGSQLNTTPRYLHAFVRRTELFCV